MIDVQRATAATDAPSDTALARFARAALTHAERDGDLAVRVVGEDEARALNARYRGRDTPTNVLSFPQAVPEQVGENLLGDIVVCAPLVAREAREQGKTLDAHYAHLVVHGVLHLLGYDHMDETQADLMEGVECAILAGLDYPNPYQPTADPDLSGEPRRTACDG